MTTTDAQVRNLMQELRKHGKLGLAAARTGMDRGTAAKYRDAGKLPSALAGHRGRAGEVPEGEGAVGVGREGGWPHSGQGATPS